jgi:hypothetical protein
VLENVQIYKCVGLVFSSNENFSRNADTLGKAAGRALGKIISKIHPLKSISYNFWKNCIIRV